MARGLFELFAQLLLELLEIHVAQELANRFGAHAGFEAIAVLVARFAILLLGEHFALGEVGVAGIDHDIGSKIDHLLELSRRHIEEDADS